MKRITEQFLGGIDGMIHKYSALINYYISIEFKLALESVQEPKEKVLFFPFYIMNDRTKIYHQIKIEVFWILFYFPFSVGR